MLCHADGVKGEAASGSNREGESTEAERRGGAAHSSEEGPVMGPERRGCVVQPWPSANWKREEPVDKAKPFKIPKREVWEAFKRVKANQGAAGVDGQSIAEFEANLSGNLYKLWKSAVVRELLSSAGAAGRHSKGEWWDATVGRLRPLSASKAGTISCACRISSVTSSRPSVPAAA